MLRDWTADKMLELAKSYQSACLLAAAADLELFGVLAGTKLGADRIAEKLDTDSRAMTVLLDALVAIGLIEKQDGLYGASSAVAWLLTGDSPDTILPMVQHHANCMRRWVQLARVTRTGKPAERHPSVRGEPSDEQAFIDAMHVLSLPVASELIEELGPPSFTHLLDIGGASGTWTIAFLGACPDATATVFDLPHVIPMTKRRVSEAGISNRVNFAVGDFYADELPHGADLVWVGAIVHQNSRGENRDLFAAIHAALAEDGQIFIRDVLVDDSRTTPVVGALFAINMLVATEGGGVFTFDELREDLEASGFTDVTLARHDEGMNSVVRAVKAHDA